jgi:serine/threonine protein kinase
MSVPTSTELLAFLEEHAFLGPSQVRQLAADCPSKFADVRALVRELVAQDWLTPFQANQLIQGRGADLLLGPYRLLDPIGEGGMGQVFKAHHVSMDRLVAIKIISKEHVANPVLVSRFYREARAVAKLSHPNIVIAYDVNQIGDTHFFVMEFVDGVNFARLVEQTGPLPIAKACEYIRQAAAGLQHAHEKGLVHRDIKPSNLLVARPNPGRPPLIKILDFGLARFDSENPQGTRLTKVGKVVGTVEYIAPEQAQSARTADIRADVYSLGCSLFYLLTGSPPFPGEDPIQIIKAKLVADVPSVRTIRPDVPAVLEKVVARMTARNPADRYHTPGEVVKVLGQIIKKSPGSGRPMAPLPDELAKALRLQWQKERQAQINAAPEAPAMEPLPSWMIDQLATETSPSLEYPAADTTPALESPAVGGDSAAGYPARNWLAFFGALIGTVVLLSLCCSGVVTLGLLGLGDKPNKPLRDLSSTRRAVPQGGAVKK